MLSMLPGDAARKKQMMANAPDEKKIRRMEAILLSMTAKERRFPQLLDGSRKRRIASGSGTRPDEINSLLKQYDVMRKMMKKGNMMQKVQNMMGGGNPGGFPPSGFPGGPRPF
jgi:signal recognition particle subunit SRP54